MLISPDKHQSPIKWTHTAALLIGLMTGCAPPINDKSQNACTFLSHNPYLLQSTLAVSDQPRTQARLLATITVETGHQAYARPVESWYWEPYIAKSYQSSSRGYAQSTNATWNDFSKYYGRTMYRLSYYDNLEFIQWYYQTRSRYIKKSGEYEANLYIIYHEGPTGYKRYIGGQKTAAPVKTAQRFSILSNAMTKDLTKCQDVLAWQNQWLTS